MTYPFTARELDIMAVLWDRGPSTVAEVRRTLPGELAHNTVLTILGILEDKGYAMHTEEGRTHRFHPLVGRETAATSTLGRLIEKVFGGSAEALATHFVRDRRLSRAELERVRRALDDRLAQLAPLSGHEPVPTRESADTARVTRLDPGTDK